MPQQDRNSDVSGLADSDELFRTLLDSVFEGVFIHDDTIHYANVRASEITGYPVERLVGMSIAELNAAVGDHGVGKPPPAVEDAHYGPIEFTGLGQDGRRAAIETQGRTVMYEGRWMWLSAFRDITAHKDIEAELRHRVQFDELVTSVSASFINVRPEEVDAALDTALARIGSFAGVDRAYIYVIEDDLLRATNMWSTQPGFEKFKNLTYPVAPFQWAIDKLRTDDHVVYDVVERDRDDAGEPAPGTERERSSLCVPMMAHGKLRGHLGFDALRPSGAWKEETVDLLKTVGYVFGSVLERQRVQQKLDRAYETMEQTVEERTRELKQKHAQLLQAEKMASLGQLVAGVAHEINTPLGAIKSNTDTLLRSFEMLREILADPATPDEVKEHKKLNKLLANSMNVNDINVQAIERIIGIVSSLRQFARLDQAEVDTVNLHEAIDNTLTLVRHQLKHRVEIKKEYGELPPVECLPDQINQVFMNLLVNAGQAIEGKGLVTIRTRARGDRVIVEFSDSGRGIPPENLSRIFDPGFTTKGVGVGTGLGLAIVLRIIEDHRGEIQVDSTPGEGSTFRVILPVERSVE